MKLRSARLNNIRPTNINTHITEKLYNKPNRSKLPVPKNAYLKDSMGATSGFSSSHGFNSGLAVPNAYIMGVAYMRRFIPKPTS